MSETLVANMQQIQAMFQSAQNIANTEFEGNKLTEFFAGIDSPYLSVAFEGVACGLAERDIEKNADFALWRRFLKQYPKHTTQIHIGLGWALALKKAPPTIDLNLADTLMTARVLDGYGYTEGLFRKRVAVVQKQLPIGLLGDKQMGYDQGLGRSLWYTAKGCVAELEKLIQEFPPTRLVDLWRGVGIAVGYVGGVEAEEIEQLSLIAKSHLSSLKTGVALSMYSRFKADTVMPESMAIADTLLKITIADIVKHFEKIEAKNYKDYIRGVARVYL